MSKIKPWRRFAVFGLLGFVLAWAVSCTPAPGPGQQASGRQEVEFWTMQLQPQFTDYFNSLIATFESENPDIKVRWVDVPWSAMESKILAAVSAKTAPDVVNLNPNFASLLAGRNAWLYLDSKVSPTVREQYLPNIWKASSLDGKSFAIPWYLTTRITIYNSQILQQAGITSPPATYAQLAEAAKQIKQKTGKYAFFVSFVGEDSAEVLQSLVQMGAQLVDAQGKAAFNTPEGKAAFQYWVDLYKNGLLPKEALTQGHRRAIELYQAGEIALLNSGPQFFKTIAQNAPAVAQVSAAAPEITGPTGKKNVAVMNLAIPQSTDQPDAALKFALFVTNDKNQLAFAKAANVLPSTKEALKDSFFSTPAQPTPVDKARVVSASQLKDAEVLIPAMKDINQLQKIIYDNLQAAMLGEKTVEQAVAGAADTWNKR
ncbi:MAG: sugar ABC transporter substrate-binding protein [Oscillatoria princeps RMCB-10]|nr:sugar ABC transporter substrate-binding protein [Oscillatoria princeps RMCB-10]